MEINTLRAAGLLWAGLSQQGCETFHYCEPPSPERIEVAPDRLSETGLFTDVEARTLAPGVRPFRPEFELWSDGADKQRWVLLPPGGTIDTSDLDDWRFPVGTKLWKEFRHGDQPVETRLLVKLGPGDRDWLALSYLWDDDLSDARAVPQGAVDARGTPFDVPAASECSACHGGRRSFVLGFSALQLASDPEGTDLAALEAAGLLSDPPGRALTLPGGTTVRSALGYLHANCGHCHNGQRPPAGESRCFDPESDLDFWLRADSLESPEQTPTYRTAIGSALKPGRPGDSRIIELVAARGMFRQMPPLATERVDSRGVQLLSTWIEELGSR